MPLCLFLFQDGTRCFVVGNALPEFAHVVVAGGVELELLHGVFARVMQTGSICGDDAVVGGEVGVERDRVGKLVDDIARRQSDIDVITA